MPPTFPRLALRSPTPALAALFVVVGVIAAFAYGINAWQVFGFAQHVWRLPAALCYAAAVVADSLSAAGLFATYLLRFAPLRVRAYAWVVFLGMTGVSIAAAESFAMWRRLAAELRAENGWGDAQIASGVIVVALALSMHLLIVVRRYTQTDEDGSPPAHDDAASANVVESSQGPGVYRAWGKSPARPIYVGSTEDFKTRLRQHRTSSAWYGDVLRWDFQPYPTIEAAQVAEIQAIKSERPLRNMYHNDVPVPRIKDRPVQPPPAPVGSKPEHLRARADAINRVLAGERAATVAESMKVSKRTVEVWVKKHRDMHGPTSAITPPVGLPKSTTNGHHPEVEVTP